MTVSQYQLNGLADDLTHTVPEVVAHVACLFGDKPFCVDEDGTTTTYAQFERRVQRLGAELLAMGIEPGDRVLVLSPNSTNWIVAATAIMSIGAIMVPVNTRFKGLEVRYVLEKTRASALFSVGEFLGTDYISMVVQACGGPGDGRPTADLPHLKHIIAMDTATFAPAQVSEEQRAAYQAAAAKVTPETTADILFTSGTTGMPKGAMHAHAQGILMSIWTSVFNAWEPNDKAAIVNPFFHSFGYRAGWMASLLTGMTVYPLATFDAGSMLELIEKEGISQLSGAPAVFFSLMEHPNFGTTDISSLRTGHTGGAKTPPDIIRAGTQKLGFDIFLTSYGLTESTAMITHNVPEALLDAVVQTVGRPVPGMEVRFVDPDGNDVPPGEQGELLTRGPLVMQGYFEDPEQTAAVIDKDGWLRTGDVAAMDENGRLRIVDRIKDVVIVGGFNAYPVEIEIMLGEHPDIAEVAIIGVPDERMGEVTAACVVLKPGKTLTLEELTAWSRERMANYKVPRHLYVLDEFPRTPLGKVQKFELRKQIAELAD